MGHFDFLHGQAAYRDTPRAIERLESRHAFLVAPFTSEIAGQPVLDLGAQDGRWSYALARAGAARVVAVEARGDVAQDLARLPSDIHRDRITLRVADVFDALEAAIAAGETYGFVAVYGLFYHVMDHFRLLSLIRQLDPKVIVIDGDFNKRPLPVITLRMEDSTNPLNATPQVAGQKESLKGIPSRSALEMMAEALGYTVAWADWQRLPPEECNGVRDYFDSGDRKLLRATAILRPKP